MRNILIITLAAVVLATGCASKGGDKQHFDGATASAVRDGEQWTITDANGHELVTDYDSMRVAEVGEDGHPATVLYFKGERQICLQFYSGMAPRSRGDVVDGHREGLWQYFYPDGTLQCEATFVDGREEGPYRVYRENGVPYYIGQYSAGARTGVWEIYDPDGNLVQKQEYQ